MIELEVGHRSRLTQVIHGIHHLIDIKDSPCREHLVICFHDSLRWNADENVVLVCKSRKVGMQGKAKRQRTRTFIVYLIGVALVTYSVWKRPEDKVTSIVLIFE